MTRCLQAIQALTFLLVPLAAQNTPPASPGQIPSATVTQDNTAQVVIQGDYINIATDERTGLTLKEFVKIGQQVTKRTFVANWTENPQIDTDKVALIGGMRVKKENFFSFFQTILAVKKYAMVPRGEDDTLFYELIFLMGPNKAEVRKAAKWVQPDDIETYKNQTGTFIVTSIPVQYVDPQRAANTLRPYFGQDQALGLDPVTPIGNAKALLVSHFGPTVYAIQQILKLVDVKEDAVKPEFQVIPLENASVEELEPLLNDLMSERSRTGARPAGTPEGVSAALVDPADTLPVKILPDPRTNSLLVMAHKDRLIEINNIVVQLDTPIPERSENYHVIPVRNVASDDVKTVVDDFLTKVQTAENQARQGGAPGATQSQRRNAKPVVVSDKGSNSLLIAASQSKLDELKRLIKELDVRQDQVLIEAALIELSTQDLASFGIELGLIDVGGTDYKRPFGFTSFGLSSFQDTDGNGLPDTRLPDFTNPARGITGGIISSKDFSIPVLANALKSDRTANVLSIPSVLVNNNKDALVVSKDKQPTGTSTVSGTGVQQSGFQNYQDAGIELRISPSISSANYLRLNIDLKVSKFTGTSSGNGTIPPPQTEREVKTEVTMPSGHTMVLGGVIEDSSDKSESGIPFLKDIPILGWLFKSYSDSKVKTNLYFFITPHILDEDDFSDLMEISYKKKLEASSYIGTKRLQMIDHAWKGSELLEDSASTLEHTDQMGGFDIPVYQKPEYSKSGGKTDAGRGEVKLNAPGKNEPKGSAPSGPSTPSGDK